MRPNRAVAFALKSACMSLLAAALANGCAIRMAEQEVQLRYDFDADTLDFLLIYKGVTASSEKETTLQDAVKAAGRVLGGRREFLVASWVGHVDADEVEEKLTAPVPAETPLGAAEKNNRQRMLRILAGFTLEEVGSFIDEKGRLSAYQRFRLEGVGEALHLLNDWFAFEILAAAGRGEFEKNTPLLDEHTRELWRRKAKAGELWMELVEGGLRLDIPMTAKALDRVQRALIDEIVWSENPAEVVPLAQLLVHLNHMEFADERLLLRFGAPVTETFHFVTRSEDPKYDTRLLDALRRRGVRIDEERTIEEVRKMLDT